MTRPRSSLVSVSDTPYYHCIGRCVRRAYLCGEDRLTGKSFEHRRQWLLERLRLLTDTFAIDLCAYALMSNHYHLVVRIAPARVKAWTTRDVVERWSRVFSGPAWVTRYLNSEPLTFVEQQHLNALIPLWVSRLADLSWFMRALNEWLARRANQEDQCTGRFWEGRFKSQALLDEGALLTAMVYVDLNPIRAGIVNTPIDADFTSIQQRLFELASAQRESRSSTESRPALLPFVGALRQDDEALPFNLQDYIDLVDTSGRHIREDKRGAIPHTQAILLYTLGINTGEWLKTVTQLQARFELFVGTSQRLRALAQARHWRWVRGHAAARRLYRKANE